MYVTIGLLTELVVPAFSQATYWSGQAQCQLTVQAPTYAYQELQTWAITGAPSANPAMVYPATWSVTGQGGRRDILGAQTTTMQWNTVVPPTSAPLAIFVNSGNQLIIKSYHSQLRVYAAVTGLRQVSVSGIAQNPTPVSFTEFEWQFPRIEVEATRTDVSGTSSTPVTSGIGPMQPPGTSATAMCQWQFVKGTAVAKQAPAATSIASLQPVSALAQSSTNNTTSSSASANTAVAMNPNVANLATKTPSQSALASQLAALPAPANFTATHVGNGVVQFTWQPVSGATKYRLDGSGISSSGVYVPAISNPNAPVQPPPPVVQNVPPGPGTWKIASLNSVGRWDANTEATASVMVRYPPAHSLQWLTKTSGAGNPASTLAQYLSLCNQCIPGVNFRDIMVNLGLQLDPLATFPDAGSGCGDYPWCGGFGSAWVDDQAARYINVTEFENSARVTGCWNIGRPNGRIVCYTKTSDHGLQVIVKQTDLSWFLSFTGDPNAEVFDWVTYDSDQLYRTPLGQRLVSGYKLTDRVTLDSEGTKYPPNACLSCHGGKLTPNGVTGATLLPLDPGLIKPTTFSIDGNEYGFDPATARKVNQAVIDAVASPAVVRYLTGLYGADPHISSGPGDSNYVPQAWRQQANTYNTGIKPYCVMCHLATPSNLDFTVPSNFFLNKDLIYAAVCSGHSMPHAEAPYKAFWTKDTGPFFLPGWLVGQLGYQSCP